MTPVVLEYFATGLVPKMPTWILSMVILIMSVMTFTAGLILDSLARSRTEVLRIHYMDLPALSATRQADNATPLFETLQALAKPRGRKSRAA